MEVWGKNAGILVNGPVLDDILSGIADIYHFLESLVQKIDLKVERPTRHVVVKIFKVRVVVNRFILRDPSQILCQQPCKSGLSAADISCDTYMHSF